MKKIKLVLMFILVVFVFNIQGKEIKLLKSLDVGQEYGIFVPKIMKVQNNIIFIYDGKARAFFKIDENLKSGKSFGKKGQGPGEYLAVVNFGIKKDKIWILSPFPPKTVIYNTSGTFLEEEKNNTKYGSTLLELISKENTVTMEISITSTSTGNSLYYNSKGGKQLLSKTSLTGTNLDESNPHIYSLSQNNCYFVPNSENYNIKICSFKNHEIADYIVKKDYKNKAYTSEELDEIKKRVEKFKSKNVFFSKMEVKIPSHKPAIKRIFADKMDNLYVITNKKKAGKYLVEVYNKDKKNITNFYIDDLDCFFIEKDKIYIIKEKGDSYLLEIYQLSL